MARLFALVLLCFPSSAFAATYYVAQDGTGDFETISDAIDAADDGDRIEVSAGTYEEAIDFGGKDLEIVGVDGSASTILDGGGALGAVTFFSGETSEALLQGFTVHNDTYRGLMIKDSSPTLVDLVIEDMSLSSLNGGGAFIQNGTPTFTSCVFQDNAASSGGHVYLQMGRVTFTDTTFTGGSASNQGGAIYVDSGSVIVENGLFEENESTSNGGAVSLNTRASLQLSDTELSDNHTDTGHGAGVYGWGSNDITISGSTFYGNYPDEYTSGYGGGALYMSSGTLTVSDSTFEANYAYYGAAMMLYTTAATFDAVTFSTNYAYYGGAIYLSSSSTLTDTDGVYDTNTSYYYGAGIYAYYNFQLDFDGTVFTENAAYYGYGGAVFASTYGYMGFNNVEFDSNYSYYSGGAIYAYYLIGDVNLTSSTFTDNSATYGYGGALYSYYYNNVNVSSSSFDTNEAYYSGGAIYNYPYGNTTITSSSFTYNAATYTSGGAIYWAPASTDYDFLMAGSDVSGNSSRYEGGGLHLYGGGSVTLQGNTILENSLEDDSFGGGVAASGFVDLVLWGNEIVGNESIIGGGVYLGEGSDETATATVLNNVVANNSASRLAGGFGAVSVGGLSMVNNTIVGNQALQGGGGVYLYDTPADFRNNILSMTVDGEAISADGAEAVAASTFQYNDLWSNAAGALSGELSTGSLDDTNLEVDPELVGYSLDGVSHNDTFALSLVSPCIDAGDPEINDLDGSRSDLGAYGGPYAFVYDADADGFTNAFDCDDADSSVYPGAPESWYDDIDQDCSGGSDYDQDGDGYDAPYDDCDDYDASVVDCPVEDTADTGDTGDTGKTDTDPPAEDTSSETEDTGGANGETGDVKGGGGCSCSSAEAPRAGGLAAIGLLALAVRRRRQG